MDLQIKPINAFYDTPDMSQQQQAMPVGGGSNNGSLANLATLNVGAGKNGMYVDQQGLWLGSNAFDTSPFSVDMNGQLIANKATFKNANGQTIIDADGVVSTAGFQSGSYADPSSVTIGGSFTNTLVTGSELTFTLAREANVMLSFFAFTSLALVSSFRDYYIQVALQLDGVVYSDFAQFKFNSSSMANQTVGATLSFCKPYVIAAGTHVLYLVWSAFSDNTSTLGQRGMNYLVLGT